MRARVAAPLDRAGPVRFVRVRSAPRAGCEVAAGCPLNLHRTALVTLWVVGVFVGEISRPVMGGGRGRCRATVVGAGDGSEWVLGIGRVIVHEKVYTRSAYRFVVNNFVSELV